MVKNRKIIKLFSISAIFVLSCICGCVNAAEKPAALSNTAEQIYKELYNHNGRVLVAAHRGDWLNVPENSIPAIQNCINEGIDIVEIDVRKTKDNQLVLMHDKTVDRTTDGNGAISKMTLAEIKRLHLKDYNGKLTEYTVPTLEEAMLTAKDKCLVNLDKIENIMLEALDVLKRTGTVNQAIFKGEKDPNEVNKIMASLDTSITYIYIIKCKERTSPTTEQIYSDIDRFKVKPVAIEIVFTDDMHPVISKRFIAAIKKRGMRVWVNTLFELDSGGHIDPLPGEEPSAWDWVVARGINIIQTNQPVRLAEYLKKK